jgi:hypothetical protein
MCFLLSSFWGCQSQTCIEYQDIATVGLSGYVGYGESFHIDSIVMKANDSIIGCGNHRYRTMIGSKTHSVKFPINVHIQLFAQGDLWEELFFEIDKNTKLKVYNKYECSSLSMSPLNFLRGVELAKEHNRFINSSFMDDYCWLLEKIDREDEILCTKLSVDGETYPCNQLLQCQW